MPKADSTSVVIAIKKLLVAWSGIKSAELVTLVAKDAPANIAFERGGEFVDF